MSTAGTIRACPRWWRRAVAATRPKAFACRRAHRRIEIRLLDRLRRARGMHARAPERSRAAAHRRTRSTEAHHRQLPRGRARGMPGAQPSAEAGTRQAPGAVLARVVDRARGFHGNPGQGLFPALSRKQGCGCATVSWSNAPAATRTLRARSPRCAAITTPTGKSGTPGSERLQGQRQHPLVSAKHAYPCEVRLYDRLFRVPHRARAKRISCSTSIRMRRKPSARSSNPR